MTSRRKFLIQGSLTTAVLLAAKPFKTFAGSSFSPFNLNSNSLVFLHTGNLNSDGESKIISILAELKNSNQNVILLKAVKESSEPTSLKYDASFQASDVSLDANEYKTIQKGTIKIGIIGASTDDSDAMEKVNKLAFKLKNQLGCDIVVCLSQLGYKSRNHRDDVTMAADSSDIDVIIGGHPDNITKHPMIILNKDQKEVIVDSSSKNETGIGNIKIDFNARGLKKMISFHSQSKNRAVA